MRRGITVIKLLLVSVVLLGLVSLLLPAVANTRRAAARMSCSNNLKQLGIGISNYHDTHSQYPSGTVPGTTLPPEQRLNFHVQVLPHIEANNLFNNLKLNEPWNSATNAKAAPSGGGCSGFYSCPDWRGERGQGADMHRRYWVGGVPGTNYVGVAGVGADAASRPVDAAGVGIFGYDRTLTLKDVKDGTANTIMLIETGHEVGPWLRGGPTTVRAIDPDAGQVTGEGMPFGGTHFRQTWVYRPPHAVAFQIALVDTSVREVKDTIDPAVLAALATIAGGEEIPAAW